MFYQYAYKLALLGVWLTSSAVSGLIFYKFAHSLRRALGVGDSEFADGLATVWALFGACVALTLLVAYTMPGGVQF